MKWLPDRKVLAGGIAGLLAWGLVAAAGFYGVTIPVDQATALVGLLMGAAAYVVPPSQWDLIKRLNNQIVAVAAEHPDVPVTKPAGK